MSTYEELFNESVLSVIAPHASLGLPKQDGPLETWTEWLGRLELEETDRRMAFFGKVHATCLLYTHLCRCLVGLYTLLSSCIFVCYAYPLSYSLSYTPSSEGILRFLFSDLNNYALFSKVLTKRLQMKTSTFCFSSASHTTYSTTP